MEIIERKLANPENPPTVEMVKSFTGTFALGSQRGYSKTSITKPQLIREIQSFQAKAWAERQVKLSVGLKTMDIILDKMIEPHYEISIIQYPKFKLRKPKFRAEVQRLALHLMKSFEQNRLVLTFPDYTLMFEMDDSKVDPRINL